MQWFVERGFKEVPLTALPESSTKAYNYKRNSKGFAKQLSTSRDLAAQELFGGAGAPGRPALAAAAARLRALLAAARAARFSDDG